MKLHIHVQKVDEIVEVRDAAEALRRTKQEAAKRATFLQRAVVNAMSDLMFASKAVEMNNAQSERNDPLPRSAQEFLDWAVERGYVSILE